jgi:hypothetical protein
MGSGQGLETKKGHRKTFNIFMHCIKILYEVGGGQRGCALVQQDGNIVLLPEMALLAVSTVDTCLALFPFPEPIVIKLFSSQRRG